jgi:hypothetical protein
MWSKLQAQIQNHYAVLYSLILAFLISFNSLGQGYLATLDLVFTPNMNISQNAQYFNLSEVLGKYLLLAVNKVIPMPIFQFIYLFAVLFFISFLFYKLSISLTHNKAASLIAGTLYLWNPFVYARILAGHWQFLIAYALLPLFVEALLNKRTKTTILIWLLASLISLHHVVLYLIVFVCIALASLYKTQGKALLIKTYAFIAISVIIPIFILNLIYSKTSTSFGQTDLDFFATKGDSTFGLMFNLLSMDGFWAENTIMLSNKNINTLWWLFFIIILLVIILGLSRQTLLHSAELKAKSYLFLASIPILLIGLVLAYGNNPPLAAIWEVFYNRIPLLQGFREPQKFLSLYIFALALLSSLSLTALSKPKFKFILPLTLIIIFTYTPALFGLWGQLKPINYPSSWQEIQNTLQNNKDSKMLVLPWRAYDFYSFTNRQIYNPAQSYFGDKAVIEQYPALTNQQCFGFVLTNKCFDLNEPNAQLNQTLKDNKIRYVMLNKTSQYQQIAAKLNNLNLRNNFEDNYVIFYIVNP